jgi:ABC-type transport system substrate-binding protein
LGWPVLSEIKEDCMNRMRLLVIGILGCAGVLAAACGGGGEAEKPAAAVQPAAPAPAAVVPAPAVAPAPQIAAQAPAARPSESQIGFSLGSFPEFLPEDIENVRYGGILRVGVTATAPHWDPKLLQAGAINSTAVYFYEKLIGWTPNPKDRFVRLGGVLAEKWNLSSDLTTLTISLRKGVKWQNIAPVNGREFVASDAVFNFNRYREKDSQSYPLYQGIQSVDAPDKYTVVIKLAEPNAWIANDLFSKEEFMVAPEVVRASGGAITTTAIGTGPYILDKFLYRRGGTYVRNPDYWQKDAKGRQLPYIDTIQLTELTDPATTLAALRTGQLDYGGQSTPQTTYNAVRTIPNLRVTFQRTNPTSGVGLAFNTKKAPWNNVDVRRAFGMLTNQQRFGELEFGDLPWGHSQPVPWEFVSDEPFTFDKLGPYYKFNPAEGKKLLIAAGFPDGKMKIASSISTSYPGRGMNAILVQQLWKEQGIEIGVTNIDGSVYSTQYYQRVHEDIGITHHNASSPDLNWFAQNKFLPEATQNHAFINDPEVNQVVKAIKLTTDPAKLREHARFLWDYNNQGVWTIWMPRSLGLSVSSARVRNHLNRIGERAMQEYPWLTDAPRTSP